MKFIILGILAVMTSTAVATTAIPVGTTWYWQLAGAVKTTPTAKVYDIDLFDNSAALFAELKAGGHIVVCYFSAGTYENWRPDAGQFPPSALGKNVDGWPGEKWLDVRSPAVRKIMRARMTMAKNKGCDSLEPDNVDGYSNGNGFGLTAANQIEYNKFLAAEAHARGLSIGLKNSTDLVSSLVGDFDFAVVEQCYQYNECSAYAPFVAQNKAVLIAEYRRFQTAKCANAKANKFSLAYFNLELNGAKFQPCP